MVKTKTPETREKSCTTVDYSPLNECRAICFRVWWKHTIEKHIGWRGCLHSLYIHTNYMKRENTSKINVKKRSPSFCHVQKMWITIIFCETIYVCLACGVRKTGKGNEITWKMLDRNKIATIAHNTV